MDAAVALSELETLAKKLEVDVVYDHFTGDGAGGGGLCKLKGRWRVIIERQSSAGERASVLARALSRFDLDPHFLSPMLRDYIQRLTGQDVSDDAPPEQA